MHEISYFKDSHAFLKSNFIVFQIAEELNEDASFSDQLLFSRLAVGICDSCTDCVLMGSFWNGSFVIAYVDANRRRHCNCCPVCAVCVFTNKTGIVFQTLGVKTIVLWLMVAFFAGVSWYSFYLALEYGKIAGESPTIITAINYASVILVLFASYLVGRQSISAANILGVFLVFGGIYLVNEKPESQPPQAQQGAGNAGAL